MNVVFCNIAWMKRYEGVQTDDMPVNGGRWVNEQSEKDLLYDGLREGYNFYCHQDGYCYGDFKLNGEDDVQLNIGRIKKGVTSADDHVSDVLVIWTATRAEGGRFIVGWYENATVYRNFNFADDEYNYGYRIKAKAENCYCIPEEKRDFQIYRAVDIGAGNGFGQANIWYADSKQAENPENGQKTKAIEYIQQYKRKYL